MSYRGCFSGIEFFLSVGLRGEETLGIRVGGGSY